MRTFLFSWALFLGIAASPLSAADQVLWDGSGANAKLILPTLPEPVQTLPGETINGYLLEACGRTIPLATRADGPGLYIVVGDEANNPVLARLVGRGLKLDRADLGDEGYRILSRQTRDRQLLIVTANTPAGLKFGCQELVFFHLALTDKTAKVDWPLDIVRRPAFSYRGIYMLPCWSAHDSLESWQRVLRFNSELTLNRNWFWLGGFPLMDKYGGEYKGTALASVDNVRGLVKLCRAEAMKFYVGDGWFTWHHAKAAAGSPERGRQYYLDLMDLLPGAEGIYLEPVGEGSSPDEKIWRPQAEGIKTLAQEVWKKRPDYEFAIAIGKFNPPEYRRLIHEIDDKRVYWWWCWGDPLQQNALAEHPLVLRWHVVSPWTDFHGSGSAPKPEELPLKGFATSYDPGQGYGNPWNGWAKLGYDKPRNLDPRTMPYFSHQYEFRERCWDVKLSKDAFWARMSRRLFDADMPPESIRHYRELESLCFRAEQIRKKPTASDSQQISSAEAFVNAHADRGTHRNRDTLMRMREAVTGLRSLKKPAASRPG